MTAHEELRDATRRLLRTVDHLSDDEYAAASLLPRWTRAHLIAHLALNAQALAEALLGVVAGEPVAMYPSPERRDSDIEALSTATPTSLRDRLLGSSTDLTDALEALPGDSLDTVIERTPGSDRTFTAGDVALMRLSEVEIHHADLGASFAHANWPTTFAERLINSMAGRPFASGFTARATDLDREWQCGDGGPIVTGTAAELGWWMSGRGTGEGLTSDDGVVPGIEGM